MAVVIVVFLVSPGHRDRNVLLYRRSSVGLLLSVALSCAQVQIILYKVRHITVTGIWDSAAEVRQTRSHYPAIELRWR